MLMVGVLSLASSVSCVLDKAVCSVSQSVKDILVDKHPPGRRAVPESLLLSDNVDVPSFDPILFDCSTGDVIKLAAFHIHGASGLFGVDAYPWHKLYSFLDVLQ